MHKDTINRVPTRKDRFETCPCKKIIFFPDIILSKFFIVLIKLYQRTISPDHSNMGKGSSLRCCKFYPTCSEYAVQTLQKQGCVFGVPKILWRLLRCHPWSRGGVDLP